MPGYVEGFKPLQKRAPRMSTLVPWRQPADRTLGILTTKDDGWLCCVRLQCPDLGSMSLDEQDAVTLRVNGVWKLLPPGSSVWHHLRQRPADALPLSSSPNVAARLLVNEHHDGLNAPGVCWTPTIYVGLHHRPPKPSSSSGFSRYLMRGQDAAAPAYGLEDFASDTEQIIGLLSTVCPTVERDGQRIRGVERLTGRALTAYLHSCISVHDHVLADEDVLDLHGITADSGFWPGTVPIIGDFAKKQYVRSVTLARPLPHGTDTAIFRALYGLSFPFDVVTRWIPKARAEAKQVTDKSQTNWLSLRGGGWRSRAREIQTGQIIEIKNTFISKQGDDADDARDHILSGDYQLGGLTMTFMIRGETTTVQPTREEMAEGNRRLMAIASVVRGAGCAVRDDPISQTENFVATWPGAAYANLDSLEMTSLNFATLALAHEPWPGITHNTHLNSPPLVYAKTEGGQRVGVDTFVGDLGDFLMPGPKGSGKSTALGFLDACWMIDATRHLYHFDVGRSCECVIRCLGGQYHDLGRGDVSMQVMADLDDPFARPWILRWLELRCDAAGVPQSALRGQYIWGAMRQLWESREPRTLTRLRLKMADATRYHEEMLQSHGDGPGRKALVDLGGQIKAALQPFVQGGAYGNLVDAPVDQLQTGRIHGFELERLLGMEAVYSAVLEIIFFRLKARRDGSPTRYVFDEAWHYLDSEAWVDLLKKDMPAWRRQNTSGGFATQSISQMQGSPLTGLLFGSAQARFFPPNPTALDETLDDRGRSSRAAYLGMGLGPEEIQRNIVMAEPKVNLYWVMPDDRHGHPQRRLIDLRLGRLGQYVCGSNTEEAHHAMDDILAKYPEQEFRIHWLARGGFTEESRHVAQALNRGDVHGLSPLAVSSLGAARGG